MRLLSKLPPIVKKVLIVLLVLIVIGVVFGGGKSKDSKSNSSKQEEQVSEPATKEVKKEEKEEKEESSSDTDEVGTKEEQEETETATDETYISPEFKEAMDSYEAFMNEYVDFMKKCEENPTDTELLMQMSEMTAREAEMTRDFDKWDESEMTLAEDAYYLEVQSRVYARLAEIS